MLKKTAEMRSAELRAAHDCDNGISGMVDAERTHALDAARENEERLRVIFDASDSGIILVSPQGAIEFANARMAEMFGMSHRELIGTLYTDHLHESEKTAGDERMHQLIQSEVQSVTHERHYIRSDGSDFWGYMSGRRLENPDGSLRSLVGVISDISVRKQAEKALSYSNSLTNAALESTADGILIVDRNGRIARWNRKFSELWRVPQELLDSYIDDEPVLSHVTSQMARPQEFLDKVLELYARPEDSSEDTLHLADGRLIERYSQPQRIGDDIVGRFWSFRDVTERHAHEKEQLKIEKLESLGVLAGGIAHDFNNILTGIMGNISFALMFIDPAHKSHLRLTEAAKASVRAGELAQQLLTFARGGEPVKKTVSIQQLVNESVSLLLRGATVKGVVDIPVSLHAVEADEGQISQVFNNIIINAKQAMPSGGTLTVTARNVELGGTNSLALPAGSYVEISFADEGCGIPSDVLKNIFDPYFTTKVEGNGLGLASAHSIVSRHGGNICAESTVGKGTTFILCLPANGTRCAGDRDEHVSQAVGSHRGGSILVMDDEEMIRSLATEMLEFLGYRVTTCVDGAEAVALYKAARDTETPFQAVVMDLTIPGGMGGNEAARRILAVDPAACMIVSSGYSQDPIMSDYATYGFSAAVAKPYTVQTFGGLLETLLVGR